MQNANNAEVATNRGQLERSRQECSILKKVCRVYWNRGVTHVTAEAKVCVSVCLVGSLRRFSKELGAIFLDFVIELRSQSRIPRICKR